MQGNVILCDLYIFFTFYELGSLYIFFNILSMKHLKVYVFECE